MNRAPTETPQADLLQAVRAGFVAQGLSLAAWCKQNDVKRQNARMCLLGAWNGPKGRELRARIVNAAGAQRFLKETEAAAADQIAATDGGTQQHG